MTIVAHITSASIGSLLLARVLPSDSGLVIVAIGSAVILDLDHIWPVIRDRNLYKEIGYRGNLHRARSWMHEMFGVVVIGYISLILGLYYERLGGVVFLSMLIHLVQDMVVGISLPFVPLDRTEIRFFRISWSGKLILDGVTVLLSICLWIAYLTGYIG